MPRIDSHGMLNALTTLAAESGMFDQVMGHEPKAAPAQTGLTCGAWVSDLRTVPSSGLASVTMRLEIQLRVFTSMLREPQDSIDPAVLDATDALLFAIVGQFQLGLSDTRYVDILGSDGEPLRATSGYLSQDSKLYRVMDIFVPIVINDVYTYAA
jgi:hypothetical protein